MELDNITQLGQFEEYYKQNGLQTTEDKIEHLKKAMNVKAVRCEYGSTDDNVLIGLEDYALLGTWKANFQ